MPRDRRLNLEQSRVVEGLRVLGHQTAIPILLGDDELTRLAAVALHDTGFGDFVSAELRADLRGGQGYYELPVEWFEAPLTQHQDFIDLFLRASGTVADFPTYLHCLCSLHKRRKKYAQILVAQPLPTMLQVSPKALLEFGLLATPALSSWITWRKWFFDIDNRAAQETGYLFEPILARALGGIPYSATKSPVKRVGDPAKGRQVDCVVGTTAYEFKIRVTIAASGQGRFAEELSFAQDCKFSGFTPVLIVLDPTPNTRLSDLTLEFEKFGGRALIGDAAWKHIEDEAGAVMGTFIEKYVRRPINEIDQDAHDLLDFAISCSDSSIFTLRFGGGNSEVVWQIHRREDPRLAINADAGDAKPE